MECIRSATMRTTTTSRIPRTLLLAEPKIGAWTHQSSRNFSASTCRPLGAQAVSTLRITTARLHASTTAHAQSPSTSSIPALTWNDFLYLRKVRRRYNQAASVTAALASTTMGISFLSQQNFEQLSNIMFGMDPMFAAGLSTVGFAAVGWLTGPLIAGGVFKIRHRKSQEQMALKERDFFERIKKYRVDPSSSSVQNPVPDYYGEKITSVGGYRQWLKDQRAFNRKRQSFV